MLKLILSTVLAFVLVGCVAPQEDIASAPQAVASCDDAPSTYSIGTERMAYADAAAYCESIGGALVEFNSTAELQIVLDAWIEGQYVAGVLPPVEALWVGTWITNVEGTEYGYAMARGGALLPVLMDGDRAGLPACEIPTL